MPHDDGGTRHEPDGARRPRVLTGDRPTGPLHLGHFVGTLQNRLRGHAFMLRGDASPRDMAPNRARARLHP